MSIFRFKVHPDGTIYRSNDLDAVTDAEAHRISIANKARLRADRTLENIRDEEDEPRNRRRQLVVARRMRSNAAANKRIRVRKKFNKQSLKPSRPPIKAIEPADDQLSVAEWSKRTGISKVLIWRRRSSGWPLERAVSEPVNRAAKLTAGGLSLTTAEWCARLGCTRGAIDARLRIGWSLEKALLTPLNQLSKKRNRTITAHGKTRTIAKWAAHLGTHKQTLHERLRKGWDPVRTVTTPIRQCGGPKPPCSECGRPSNIKGLCHRDYARARKVARQQKAAA